MATSRTIVPWIPPTVQVTREGNTSLPSINWGNRQAGLYTLNKYLLFDLKEILNFLLKKLRLLKLNLNFKFKINELFKIVVSQILNSMNF